MTSSNNSGIYSILIYNIYNIYSIYSILIFNMISTNSGCRDTLLFVSYWLTKTHSHKFIVSIPVGNPW